MWGHLVDFMRILVKAVGTLYKGGLPIYAFLGSFIAIFSFHHSFYSIIGLFFTRKFKRAEKQHKYGIVIAARNEEAVIGNLLDSINKQDYPKELVTVFVVADNCDDNTAKVAREKGAICYERFNTEERTKGFALRFLFENIEKDYGTDSFEGYFVFDADNLLKKDYISRMNDSFDEGCKIITSYRNTKNFNESWIASTYALHWLRSIRSNHMARAFFHLATNIQGTVFLFSNEIVKDGWNYTSLTEDRALTADSVVNGYEITYNDEAVFYDEQPNDLKIAIRQRIRWAKGHLLAFKDSGWGLVKNIFFANPKRDKEKSIIWYIWDCIRYRWMSFDTFAQLIPRNLFYLFRWIPMYLIIFPCYCYIHGTKDIYALYTNSFMSNITNYFIGDFLTRISPGWKAFFISIIFAVWFRICYRIGRYFANTLVAVYLFIVERKRIIKMSIQEKILYCLTWPVFDIIGRYAQYAALFMKVTWKTIPHDSKVTIEDIQLDDDNDEDDVDDEDGETQSLQGACEE